jgi:hypothetical protein
VRNLRGGYQATDIPTATLDSKLQAAAVGFPVQSAFSVTDPASFSEHRPISEYRHAGNVPCRSDVARGSPRLFNDKLLTSRRQFGS